jgi:uncharacterized membrane protein YqjE
MAETTDVSLREAIRSLGDNLGKLFSEHVALLRVEFKREGARLGVIALLVGVGLLLACSGYLVLMGAVVALLSETMSVALAATIVGAANLGVGAGVVVVAFRRLKADADEPSVATDELAQDVREVGGQGGPSET